MNLVTDWKLQYRSEHDHIPVAGFTLSTKECRKFLSTRVSAKLVEADGSEELRQHLIEMEPTGFKLQGLAGQLDSSPRAKDWEIGEAIAEAILEDEHEAMFPWPTGFDKRARNASLPGPDLIGFQNHAAPQFVFGQVKSSSERRTPPQIVHSTEDSLCNQMYQLRHCPVVRQQLVGWLLVRMRGTSWEDAFNDALRRYADDRFWLVGVLVSGEREPNENDFVGICAEIQHQPGKGEVDLLGYYLPFHKDEWNDAVYGMEGTP